MINFDVTFHFDDFSDHVVVKVTATTMLAALSTAINAAERDEMIPNPMGVTHVEIEKIC